MCQWKYTTKKQKNTSRVCNRRPQPFGSWNRMFIRSARPPSRQKQTKTEDFESIKYRSKDQKVRNKDKRKKPDPIEVASYDQPWWLRSILLSSWTVTSHGNQLFIITPQNDKIKPHQIMQSLYKCIVYKMKYTESVYEYNSKENNVTEWHREIRFVVHTVHPTFWYYIILHTTTEHRWVQIKIQCINKSGFAQFLHKTSSSTCAGLLALFQNVVKSLYNKYKQNWLLPEP